MKTKTQWLLVGLALFMAVLVFACSKNPAAPDKASNVVPRDTVPTATPFATAAPTATATPTAVNTPTPVVTASPSGSFQNFEVNNGTPDGTGNYFWTYPALNSFCDFSTDTIHVHGGVGRAVSMTAVNFAVNDVEIGINPSMTVDVANNIGIDLSQATTFYIWIYDNQGNNDYELALNYLDGTNDTRWPSSPKSGGPNWTKYTWDLSTFPSSKIKKVKNIKVHGWWPQGACFDDAGWE